MHNDNFAVDIATSKALSTTIILNIIKQNIHKIKGVTPTLAINRFLYGKCVSER